MNACALTFAFAAAAPVAVHVVAGRRRLEDVVVVAAVDRRDVAGTDHERVDGAAADEMLDRDKGVDERVRDRARVRTGDRPGRGGSGPVSVSRRRPPFIVPVIPPPAPRRKVSAPLPPFRFSIELKAPPFRVPVPIPVITNALARVRGEEVVVGGAAVDRAGDRAGPRQDDVVDRRPAGDVLDPREGGERARVADRADADGRERPLGAGVGADERVRVRAASEGVRACARLRLEGDRVVVGAAVNDHVADEAQRQSLDRDRVVAGEAVHRDAVTRPGFVSSSDSPTAMWTRRLVASVWRVTTCRAGRGGREHLGATGRVDRRLEAGVADQVAVAFDRAGLRAGDREGRDVEVTAREHDACRNRPPRPRSSRPPSRRPRRRRCPCCRRRRSGSRRR